MVHGFVQGVGYRYFVKRIADKHGLSGFVRNMRDGSVEIFVEGAQDTVSIFEKEVSVIAPGGAEVYDLQKSDKKPRGLHSFTIESSA